MLAKKSRLSAAEVREILRAGRLIRGTTVSVRYLPSATRKAAVVVNSKVARKAVERNRIRRFVYNSLRAMPPHSAHAVFLVRSRSVDPIELKTICSKLS